MALEKRHGSLDRRDAAYEAGKRGDFAPSFLDIIQPSLYCSPMPHAFDLYEHLITRAMADSLRLDTQRQSQIAPIDPAEGHEWLARYFAVEVASAMRGIRGDHVQEQQVRVVNHLLAELRRLIPGGPAETEDVENPLRLLLAKHHGTPPPRTELPFSMSTVLTRAHGEPTIGHELGKEIATADTIDALISFVTFTGVRALRPELEAHAQAGRKFRLLTTTYMGATEAKAVEALARLPQVEVRISYDTRRTRLHAKAWLFSRQSGLDTAYIGSANLSAAALFHGNEWMMKATAHDLPSVIQKFRGTFETLWNDGEFEGYDPHDPDQRQRLIDAIADERGGNRAARSGAFLPIFFTLRPYAYQAEILDRLAAERELHGHHRNLVIAATGTGKTVIAAFDYLRQIAEDGLRPRLLFLAHREEILHQALATFRNVLRDGAFGSILAGGQDPEVHDHLFASVQSFNSRNLIDRLGPNHWEYVVLDECHHVPAASYRAMITELRPKILLGLTATPERADGKSLLPDFDERIAAEIRLWQALERQLLVPFEYYGIADNTDLREVRWSRGAYSIDALSSIYSSNDRRAELVIEQTLRRIGDPLEMRALGFCVSVDHAMFMARKFTEAGIPAVALHGDSSPEERSQAPHRLRTRQLNAIFTCDLYNEGIDMPYVDTLILLRPTSSAALFLQQLGRGLRLNDKKSSCVVLDFIGQHREDFRFDPVLTALTGISRGDLADAAEQGFPTLPAGCHLSLDRVVREQILSHLRRQLRGGETKLAEELKLLSAGSDAAVSLRAFLSATGRDLSEVYTERHSWGSLRRKAGFSVPPAGPEASLLQGKMKQLLHMDDPDRLAFYGAWLQEASLPVPTEPMARRRLMMLAYQFFHASGDRHTPESFAELLRRNPYTRDELRELFAYQEEAIAIARQARLPNPNWPLALHRRYSRREILTATGMWNETSKPTSREGVARLSAENAELLFVTLDKSGKRFSPTTSYEDYAISSELFHWQTQGNVTPTSPTGRRYIEQAANGCQFHLFVRETIQDVFTYLGPASYVDHAGSRPISVTWRLQTPIPGKYLQAFLRLSA